MHIEMLRKNYSDNIKLKLHVPMRFHLKNLKIIIISF